MPKPNTAPLDALITEAYRQPLSALTRFVSTRLRALYPDYGLIETEDGDFNYESFAEQGFCTLSVHQGVFAQRPVGWNRGDNTIFDSLETGVWDAEWGGQWFLIFKLVWSNNGCAVGRTWVIGPSRAAIDEFYAEVCKANMEVEDEILVFQDGYWSKSEDLYAAIQSTTFDNLILGGTLKDEVRADAANFFAARELYERYNIPWKRGIILIGPPGNGKTHTVKALINELKRPCLYVKSVISQYEQPHHNIRIAFEKAREMAPCVLVLEDLDALITDESRSFFLNEVDGFANNTGVIIVATTNHPEQIDPAILNRPSRFDRKYTFGLPDMDCRLAYIRRWNETLDPELRLSAAGALEAAERTDGFSFAYLKELFLTALMSWINTDRSEGLDRLILGQIDLLREQMRAAEQAPEASGDE